MYSLIIAIFCLIMALHNYEGGIVEILLLTVALIHFIFFIQSVIKRYNKFYEE